MTIIFGCTFDGGVAVCSDSLGHDTITKKKVHGRQKLRELANGILVAKAGYGSVADVLYGHLERECRRLRVTSPKTVTEILMEIARNSKWLRGHADAASAACPGLFYIVGGLEDDGSPALYWIDGFAERRGGGSGIGRVHAFGTRERTMCDAISTFENGIVDRELRLDTWAAKLIELDHTSNPCAVDFPGDLRIACEGAAARQISIGISGADTPIIVTC